MELAAPKSWQTSHLSAERTRLSEQDARFTVALSTPVRLSILGELDRDGPLSCRVIADRIDEQPSHVRNHLRALERMGVVSRPRGQALYAAHTDELWSWLRTLQALACGALSGDPISRDRR